MKIAVTSQNFKTVTNHAGKARRFIIFQVSDTQEIKEIDRLDLEQDFAFCNFQGAAHPIDGVDVILSASFGDGFAQKMKKRGIIASVAQSSDIAEAIKQYLANGQTVPSTSPEEEHDHSGCGCSCGR